MRKVGTIVLLPIYFFSIMFFNVYRSKAVSDEHFFYFFKPDNYIIHWNNQSCQYTHLQFTYKQCFSMLWKYIHTRTYISEEIRFRIKPSASRSLLFGGVLSTSFLFTTSNYFTWIDLYTQKTSSLGAKYGNGRREFSAFETDDWY